jgi:hypothetical protein
MNIYKLNEIKKLLDNTSKELSQIILKKGKIIYLIDIINN